MPLAGSSSLFVGELCRASAPDSRCHAAMTREHENLRSHADAAVEIDHVSVEHADAPARYFVANRFRHVGAVNTIDRAAEIYGAGTQWIAFATRHPARKV